MLSCLESPLRASGATHRSLPDIPTVDDIEAVRGGALNERGISAENGPGGNGQAGDTNSDLYATVGDKVVGQQQPRSMLGREYLLAIITAIAVAFAGERGANCVLLPERFLFWWSAWSASDPAVLLSCLCVEVTRARTNASPACG